MNVVGVGEAYGGNLLSSCLYFTLQNQNIYYGVILWGMSVGKIERWTCLFSVNTANEIPYRFRYFISLLL